MKKILSIVALASLFVMSSFAQDSNSKRLALGIYGGIQVPGYGDDHLDVGPWLGLSVNIPTGLGWCIQFEYNFWKSTNYSRDPDQDLYAAEIPLLVGYRIDFTNTYFQTFIGPGIVSSSYYLFTGDNDFLVSFDVALKIGLLLSNNFDGFLQLRKQWAGSLNFGGGGGAYNPWLIGLGIQYRLSK